MAEARPATEFHVACAADAAYVPHAAAMLRSAVVRQPRGSVHVHFLHGPELHEQFLSRLRSVVNSHGAAFHAHPIDDARVAGLPEMRRIPRVMWYRLFLPELLPGVERVLYLDCDTQVLDSLAPLWSTDLAGCWLGAVSNVFERGRESRATALGLQSARDYFNSGVLLMNLGEWRRDGCTARIVQYARENARRLEWPDQDALNAVLARRWRPLHPRWNCQNSIIYFAHAAEVFGADAVREAVGNPGILHFEGGEFAKPWHYLSTHPHRAEYYRNLADTPWAAPPPESRSIAYRILRRVPISWIAAILGLSRRVRSRLKRLAGRAGLGRS